MPHTSPDHAAATSPVAELRFDHHTFGAYCYDTRSCRIVYDGHEHVASSQEHDARALDPVNDPPSWRGGEIVDRTFPGPVEISWQSLDGTPLKASIDLDRIFKDRRILHRVPKNELPKNALVDDPAIIVVVDNRKVDVYMRAFVPTLSEQIPGNSHSTARTDLMLAWSHTY
ncbi:hypothetical protein [Lysobacter claricitrinus]|uniref:hypothetical protein n=1 Tax=Lysobacter claricitrinus TaxID=3367728 RepID=UPI0037DBD8A5